MLQYLRHVHKITFEVSGQGHSYISVVVAFLLVARVNMSLARFNESRGYLGVMYRETRKTFALSTQDTPSGSRFGTLGRSWIGYAC